MKALTLHQPWASLIADGRKRFETRSWRPATELVAGDLLAIHAGRTMDAQACLDFGMTAPFDDHVPLGAVLCVTRLVGLRQTTNRSLPAVSDEELGYGDWSPGRWAWEVEVVERFDPPIPARGRQGLWDWEPAATEAERRGGEDRG